MTALIVFAHGSSIESANEAVRAVAGRLALKTGRYVVAAFLEGGQPDLAGAVAQCARQGAARVAVLPYFLTLGLHLQRDLPRLIDAVRLANPSITVDVAQSLDGHPALLDALMDRSTEVL